MSDSFNVRMCKRQMLSLFRQIGTVHYRDLQTRTNTQNRNPLKYTWAFFSCVPYIYTVKAYAYIKLSTCWTNPLFYISAASFFWNTPKPKCDTIQPLCTAIGQMRRCVESMYSLNFSFRQTSSTATSLTFQMRQQMLHTMRAVSLHNPICEIHPHHIKDSWKEMNAMIGLAFSVHSLTVRLPSGLKSWSDHRRYNLVCLRPLQICCYTHCELIPRRIHTPSALKITSSTQFKSHMGPSANSH